MSDPVQLDLLDWLAALPPEPLPVVPEPMLGLATPDQFPVLLTRVDPTHNMHRFYCLVLTQSLFGEAGVVRTCGRIGTSGQSRTDWYGEHQEADTALHAPLRAKRRRGYSS